MNFRFVGSVVFSVATICRLGAAEAPALLTVDGVKISAAKLEHKKGRHCSKRGTTTSRPSVRLLRNMSTSTWWSAKPPRST